ILALRESLPKFASVQTMSTSELKRFFRLPRFEDHLELARIHAVAGDGDLSGYDYAAERFMAWSKDEIAPSPLISGEDLIGLGYRPGPLFKEVLTRVEDEQLEGRLTSRDEAVEFVRTEYGERTSS